MTRNIKKLLFILAIMALIIGMVQYILCEYCYTNNETVKHILNPVIFFLYSFVAPISAALLSGYNLKRIIALIFNKQLNYRAVIYYVVISLVLFPVIYFMLVFLFGNLLGINGFGTISNISWAFVYSGILPYIIMGLTYYALLSLSSEVVWRGILEQDLQCKPIIKYLSIGFCWWLWSYLSIIYFRDNLILTEMLYTGTVSLCLCIVLSFYLASVVKSTHTVIASSCIIGLISSSSVLFAGIQNANWQVIGNNSIVTVISIMTLYIITQKLVKSFNLLNMK